MNRHIVIPLLLVLALGSCAASWLQFKSTPLDGSEPQTATGLLRVPEGGGRYPAIVLLPDCDGIGPHERQWARDLTEAGYVTYVIDHHFTRGIDDGCAGPLPQSTLMADALGALATLAGHDSVDARNMAVIGWGVGGDVALGLAASGDVLAQAGDLRAVAAFYPTCAEITQSQRPTMVIVPENDPSAEPCDAYARSQAENGESMVRIVPVLGARPGFDCAHCPDGYRGGGEVYDPAAAQAVRQILLDDLERMLKAGSAS